MSVTGILIPDGGLTRVKQAICGQGLGFSMIKYAFAYILDAVDGTDVHNSVQ